MGPFEREVENNWKANAVNTPEFPRLYAEYISETENCSLKEAARRSLSRIFNLFTDPKRNVAIITAFRGEFGLPENRARNRQLMADLRAMGYGYAPVIGGWIEHTEDGKERKVEEESLVVSGPVVEALFQDAPVEAPGAIAGEKFQQDMLKLIRKYDQDGVLLKLSGTKDAIILNKDGTSFRLGPWKMNSAAQYYTTMRRGGQLGKRWEFAFECAGTDTMSTRQAVRKFFEARGKQGG